MKRLNRDKLYAWIIGFGLCLFAVHNVSLTKLATSESGVTWFFIPQFGFIISFMVVLFAIYDNYKKITLGSRYVYIPLLIIVASIAISGFINESTLIEKLVPMLFGIYLFGVYLVGRLYGRSIMLPFAIFMVIEAISCVIVGIITKSHNGGIANWLNYDMATGILIFGSLVFYIKRQWILVGIALIGLLFTGSEEAIIAVAILGITVLIRRDFSKKLAYIGIGFLIIIGVLFATNHMSGIYNTSLSRISTINNLIDTKEQNTDIKSNIQVPPYGSKVFKILYIITGGRNEYIERAIEKVSLFGYGYSITQFTNDTIHNIPLVIVDQVGIFAGIAWLFLMFFMLFRYKYKYAVIGILACGLFDHYLWTQVAPWVWAFVGMATVSVIKNDYLLKEAK